MTLGHIFAQLIFFSTTFVQKNVLKIDFLGGKTVY